MRRDGRGLRRSRGRAARPLWDAGAQPERTYQAWTRTSLAAGVCALVLVRLTGRAGAWVLVLAGVVGAGAVALAVAQFRRLRAGATGPAPGAVAAATALPLLVAAGGVAAVLAAARGR